MSDLATTVTVIDACGRAAVPVLLLSDPGMGKSSLVRGIAALSLAGVVLLAAHLDIHDVDSLARWCGVQLQQLPAPFNRNA